MASLCAELAFFNGDTTILKADMAVKIKVIPLIAWQKRSSISSKKTNSDPKVRGRLIRNQIWVWIWNQNRRRRRRSGLVHRHRCQHLHVNLGRARAGSSIKAVDLIHPWITKAEEAEIKGKPEKNSDDSTAVVLVMKQGVATLLKRIKRTPEKNKNVSPLFSTIFGDGWQERKGWKGR